MTEAALPLWKRLLFGSVAMVGVPTAIISLIEGCSSLVLWQRDQWHAGLPVLEQRHKEDYDSLLGWVNPRNFFHRDLFAPGVYLRTNAQGFRDDHVIASRVPPGRVRAVCSGDSFTFGFGVDNDHTWCALLERKIPRLETVNMGVSAYGVDQMYLRYKRDASTLDHDVHIFALIMHDFQRMRRGEFVGSEKPVLQIDGDSLRLENVPVPSWSYRMPRLARSLSKVRWTVAQLQTAVLIKRLQQRVSGHRVSFDEDSVIRQMAERVLVDLTKLSRSKNVQLVVVLLPTRWDWAVTSREDWRRTEDWRHMLNTAAERHGYLFVDLQDEFRRLRRDSLDLLFFAPHALGGHPGDSGHQWVADRLYQHLLASPKIVPLLK
jgi:hypothetical protein